MNERNIPVLSTLPQKAQQKLIELRMKGWTIRQIKQYIIQNYPEKKVSEPTITKWFNNMESESTKLIFGDAEFKNRTQNAYAEALTQYMTSMKKMNKLLREVTASRKLDMIGKSKCATQIFAVIREGMLTAKEVTVGSAGADRHMIDIDKEMEKVSKNTESFLIVKDIPKD